MNGADAPAEHAVMRFFRRRQLDPEPEVGPSVDRRVAPEPDPIALFRADGITEGRVERTDNRLSDRLNGGWPVQVLLRAPDGSERWAALQPDEVIAVATAEEPVPSPKRMARRRGVLELKAPPYAFSGTDPSRYARSTSQRWLALT